MPVSASPPSPTTAPRLDVLDGLRGIAVLLVLWFHVWEISWRGVMPPWPSWLEVLPETGFIGVPIFFFLSGFVISYPFARWQWGNAAKPSWRDFAWRRFIKIFPSYALSILIAYSIGYTAGQGGAGPVQDIITHLLFIHTWFLPSYGAINGVLWTLAVEVEFYVIFPLVWWCFRRSPWVTFVGLLAVALIWRNVLAACCINERFQYWEENLPGYVDMFACGMMACHFYTRWGIGLVQNARTRALATLTALVGFFWLWRLLVSLYDFRFYQHGDWAGVWQIDNRTFIGLSLIAIALGSLLGAAWLQRTIANPVLKFFATISYNLYLYHQMIARELLLHHIPRATTIDPHSDEQWKTTYTWMAMLAATAQATLFTYAFERPLLRLKGHLLLRGTQRPTRDISS